MSNRKLTHAEWLAEATAKFGKDSSKWRFVCPSCGHVASIQDWKDAGASQGEIAFSCIGRRVGDRKAAVQNAFKKAGGPCNYAGGGLFAINPVEVVFGGDSVTVFEFAEPDHVA